MNRNISHEINYIETRKDGHTLWYTHFRKLFALLCLMLACVGAWAADYVIAYVNGGTTYYLARNGTTGVQRVTTFNPTTCVWSCEDENGTPSTLNNSNTYGWLYQTVNGTKYYLRGYYNDLTTDKATGNNNTTRWRTDGNTYVYNRYSNNNSYFINLQNGVARANTASGTCARSYLVSTGGTDFSVSISYPSSDAYIGNVGGTMTISAQVSGNYAPAYYNFNNKYYYTANGTTYTEANSAPQVYQFNYNYEIISGGSNASITGNTVTYTKDAGEDVDVTVRVTATPQGYASVTRTEECTFTLRSATLAAPTVNRIAGTNKYEITYPAGATARYSTNGTDINEYANNGMEYTDVITVTTPGAVIKTRAVRDGVVSAQTEYTVKDVILDAPVISIADDGTVTITNPNTFASDATIHYTVDGSDPTASSATYGSSFTVSNGATVKAIISKAGYTNSKVAEKRFVIESGVSDGVVTLNDYEDHTWTYYAGVPTDVDGGNYNTNYKGKLYSPNPRNVKITYNATNNAAVSIDESATSFVYYKTLEEGATTGQYPYQVISNPFSKRPAHSGTTYYGFAGWKVTSGYEYMRHANGTAVTKDEILALDENIYFTDLPYLSTNCTSAEIIFETTWESANRTYISTNPNSNQTYTFSSGTYETNFIVINVNYTRQITISGSATIMMVEPDGSADYRTKAYSGALVPATGAANTTKIEYANWTNTGDINAQGRNLTIGRGVTHSGGTLYGTNTDANINQVFKIESGSYKTFYAIGGSGPDNNMTKQHITFGNDYDRANNNNNSKMRITNSMYLLGKGANTGTDKLIITAKSGSFTPSLTHTTAGASGNCFYLSYNSGTTRTNHRTLIIEGGEFWHIAGGYDNYTSTDVNLKLRVKGGIIHGCIYGGAAQYPAGGSKQFVFTGGTVEGWIAGGANGYLSSQAGRGQTNGYSYVYVGGNTVVDSDGDNTGVDNALGGNVYGAGCGNADLASAGRIVNGSNVVLADNAFVERGVYGGGAYGESQATANVYVTGGHVASGYDTKYNVFGGVYGGARQKGGGSVNIYMTGGLIEGITQGGNNGGGLFGGSNYSGTITNNVTMRIDGGQVGTDSKTANIHGGGYGQNTQVTQNVDITLGYQAPDGSVVRDGDGVLVYGDVYGGSAFGSVNGTAANTNFHTNVTMNTGYIHGSLYGGALGNAGTAANVYGPVAVTVNGGSVFDGAVYGCNNINGTPQRDVTVTINGTNMPTSGYALNAVYGGGNMADYIPVNGVTGFPKVYVNGCENSIKDLYGGGNAASVPNTYIEVQGGLIDRLFAGGNGESGTAAHVGYQKNGTTTYGTGNTYAKIMGGEIHQIFGGSNSLGKIHGTITLDVDKEDYCDVFRLGEIYGGGNEAPSQSGKINIGCTGTYTPASNGVIENGYIRTVYGGANAADVTGNINLSITGGHIDNVFGGNNERGAISGTISVTVNDAGTCTMLVGNVYGGGNKAAYGTGTNYPVVNIQNGHLTGSVFGGGLGETAVVTGNPQVTIGQPSTGTVHIDGNVFGGGDAANVVGKPVVLVQNCNTMIGTKTDGNWNATGGTVYGGGNAAHVTGAGNGTSVTINGGDINRVFGGGNGEVSPANVEGNAVTTIHAGNIHQAFAGSNMQGNINGSATITVDHDGTCDEKIDEVYGGGNQAAGNAGTVTIDCGAIVDDVYGGANQADINSPITLNITGGTINRVFGGNNTSGNISGAIIVNVNKSNTCDLDLNYVYGAGNQAAYTPSTPGAYPAVNILKGTVKKDVFGGGLGSTAVVTSNPTVTINGGTVSGNVFGGGSEANTVGTTSVTVQAGTVSTDVYGGGALADVEGNTTVAVTGGTVTGNAYGGGLGRLEDAEHDITAVAAAVTGNTTVNVSGGTTNNVFGCNNFNGGPQGTVNVTISGGTVTSNVYGGGNLAAASANPIVTINGGTMQDVYGGGLGEPAVITGNTTITINKTAATMSVRNVFGGGSAANVAGNTEITMTEGTVSNIYGGGEAANVVVGADETGKTVVTMNGGTVSHSIYGGGLGNTTNVATSTTVTANGGTVSEDVYGGSGFGKVGATTVTINNGATITRDVFGGGFGQNADAGAGKEAYEADVTGNASVTINKGAVINGNVYGGNNTNGSPKGTITVLVDGPATDAEPALNLKDVFGGGKNAATTSDGAPQVTIRGCETVIARVFGGGDAASAPATDVTIWGGHITSAFAGGNGENVPAHVGYEADGTTAYTTGDGEVTITIKGGDITNVYGGSNNAGNIRGTVNVVVDKDPAACDLDVTNLFGGGNLAPSKGGTLTIACTGDGTIDNVYGGANQADVEGDVTLVINGGNIGNAFGGNNQSGTINGAIRVEVDWTGSTCTNNNLDNVYGGGNIAPYTTPNGKVGPTVQLINATINNNVYGGGLGAPAKVTGDPIVTLEGATVTGNIFGGGDAAPVEGNPTVTATEGSAAKIFGGGKGATAVVTGNPTAVLNKTDNKTLTVTEIYGGGDAAEVTGNTTVTLTKGAVTNAFGGGNAAAINGSTLVTIANTTASNVYGGGNLAGVSSTATINMNGGNVTTGLYGGCNSEGTITGDITVNVTNGTVGTDAEHKANVHGGGYGSATQTAGNVAVAINGASVVVYGDIYGGSALGNVNDNTDDNTTVTITAGTINGDVYGGGLGDASNAALVNGNVAVNINGGTVTGNVFGCNNVNGTPKGSVAVTVAEDANATLEEVYGGGNMATYAPTTAQAPVVTINGCGNTIGYVYGGGNAADVPATNVTVWGGTIGNVFGGGHGDKDAVPATAANVDGNVTVNIKGGTITNVFAGSNSKGNIGGTVALTIDKDGDCPMHITDVYGGGNQADGKAGTITIGCTGDFEHNEEGIGDVYGGANEANIGSSDSHSNIELNITGGHINRVFGGNNKSGTIYGTITVNVDWVGSCGKNYLGYVYGGGNQAAYSAPNADKNFPKVYVRNATIEHSVFGGGLGDAENSSHEPGSVNGNPQVLIGEFFDDEHIENNKLTNHSVVIHGSVYGGGSAAKVEGSTSVTLQTFDNDSAKITVKNEVFGGGMSAPVTRHTNVLVKGSTVDGYVYGGGSQGAVGDEENTSADDQDYTKVVVDQSEVKQDVFGGGLGAPVYGNTAVWIKGENCFIHGSVLGGGFGGDVTGDTHVQIGGDTDKYKKCHLTGGADICDD